MSDQNHSIDPDDPQIILRQRLENLRIAEVEAQTKFEKEKARKDRKEELREARRVRAAAKRAANPQ